MSTVLQLRHREVRWLPKVTQLTCGGSRNRTRVCLLNTVPFWVPQEFLYTHPSCIVQMFIAEFITQGSIHIFSHLSPPRGLWSWGMSFFILHPQDPAWHLAYGDYSIMFLSRKDSNLKFTFREIHISGFPEIGKEPFEKQRATGPQMWLAIRTCARITQLLTWCWTLVQSWGAFLDLEGVGAGSVYLKRCDSSSE